MAKYSIVRSKRLVDPNFDITDEDENASYTDDYDVDEEEEYLDTGDEAEGVETPQILGITQRTRQDNSGRTVVDLILEVEEIEGIVKYDTRVST